MPASTAWRRFPIGVEFARDGSAHARIWAPGRRRVEIVPVSGTGRPAALSADDDGDDDGYVSGPVPGLAAGDRYLVRLDGEDQLYSDPASRFQPEGPHGPSMAIDPARYKWSDGDWRGIPSDGQVIYELHLGTFTPEGTYAAATRELPRLRELGVTTIEVMPLSDFAGRFGWGYDGVNLWAPTRLYGTPDELRAFVDAAHRTGLAVILDVVYNHLGPDGNFLPAFSPHYFTRKYENEWGASLNFDGEASGPVREHFVENAAYWIEELRFDGLRLDATQSIHDDGAHGEHVIAAIARRVRQAGGARTTYVVAENEPQETRIVRAPEDGGYGLDALWNDDFHHSALVALTGHNEAYFSDHLGAPQELVSALKWGYLFQGQWYAWQKRGRGSPALDRAANQFVTYIENHDQVANTGTGARLSVVAAPGRLRAMTALLLLGPGTPMLFQGQEYMSSRPFFYFADHDGELGAGVTKGRREFLRQFPSLASPEAQERVADPTSMDTFLRCKLDPAERSRNEAATALHRDLLRLRRSETILRLQRADRMHGAILGAEALALRFLGGSSGGGGAEDRLLLVNLGHDLPLSPIPEPLLAPPEGAAWRLRWCSEAVTYGGAGVPTDLTTIDQRWRLPGSAAALFAPEVLT